MTLEFEEYKHSILCLLSFQIYPKYLVSDEFNVLEANDPMLYNEQFERKADIAKPQSKIQWLQMFAEVAESVRESVVVSDPNLTDCPIVFTNPYFQKLTGYSQSDVIGRNCRFLQGEKTDPAAAKHLGRDIVAARTSRIAVLNYRQNGQKFTNLLTMYPCFVENEPKPEFFIAIQCDVSQKKSWLELAHLNAILSILPTDYEYATLYEPVFPLSNCNVDERPTLANLSFGDEINRTSSQSVVSPPSDDNAFQKQRSLQNLLLKEHRWSSYYLKVSKRTIDVTQFRYQTARTVNNRKGLQSLLKSKAGKQLFASFLENLSSGLSFWLDAENYKIGKKQPKEIAVQNYKSFLNNATSKMRKLAETAGKAISDVRNSLAPSLQTKIINFMALDLYPEFLESNDMKTLFNSDPEIYAQQMVVLGQLNRPKNVVEWLQGFSEICEHISETICVSDPTLPDCPIVYTNPAFETTTGYSLDDILGRNCRFLQGPDTDPKAKRQLREDIVQSRETKIALLNYRKDGTTFENMLTMKPVRIHEQSAPRLIVALQLDLSKTRSPLEAFQFQTILDLIPNTLKLSNVMGRGFMSVPSREEAITSDHVVSQMESNDLLLKMTTSQRNALKNGTWGEQLLRRTKVTLNVNKLSFGSSITTNSQNGLKALLSNPTGLKYFSIFLEEKSPGLSFWLDAERVKSFVNGKEQKEAMEKKLAKQNYKMFVLNKASKYVVKLHQKVMKTKEYKAGQDAIERFLSLDFYPEFLHSREFQHVLNTNPNLYENQLGYRRGIYKSAEAMEWLQMFSEIADLVNETVCISDPTIQDCPIVYVNKAFERTTGYSREEVLGRNCRFLQGPDTDPGARRQLREDIINSKETKIRLLNYRKDGSTFENLLTMKPIKLAGQKQARFIAAIQFDVTEPRSPLEVFQLQTILQLIPNEVRLADAGEAVYIPKAYESSCRSTNKAMDIPQLEEEKHKQKLKLRSNKWDTHYLDCAERVVHIVPTKPTIHLKKQRDGLRKLLKHTKGKQCFGKFLEQKAIGLSFWLDAKNLKQFDGTTAKCCVEEQYKTFNGVKKAGTIIPVLKQAVNSITNSRLFNSAQDSIINFLAFDLYLEFLRSPFFDELAGSTIYEKQIVVDAQAARPKSAVEWLENFIEVAELIPDTICISDPTLPDCPIVYVNKAFKRTTGYSKEDILGRNCRFLQGPETDPEAVNQIRKDIAMVKQTKIKLLNYRKSGQKFWNLLTMQPIKVPGADIPRYIVAIQFDITKPRNALHLFQLQTIIDLLPETIKFEGDTSTWQVDPPTAPSSAELERSSPKARQSEPMKSRFSIGKQLFSKVKLAGKGNTAIIPGGLTKKTNEMRQNLSSESDIIS